jgi:exopolysaccharide biosynthesis polyprenyl glycosylphosphotransferase
MKIQLIIKRLVDIIGSITLLIILLPLMLIISLIIKMDSSGPVIFVQERIGKDRKPFNIYKFRTMVLGAEHKGTGFFTGENDSRVTRVGRLLRKTSLDELPQLINVLKGDMSLIGPRPTLRYQVEKYNDFQLQRLKMKPGITGLAQVNGRNSIPWEERIKYDVEYVNNYSLLLDFIIFIKTIAVLFKTDSVYGEKDEMM